jgi:hypothetical protein
MINSSPVKLEKNCEKSIFRTKKKKTRNKIQSRPAAWKRPQSDRLMRGYCKPGVKLLENCRISEWDWNKALGTKTKIDFGESSDSGKIEL